MVQKISPFSFVIDSHAESMKICASHHYFLSALQQAYFCMGSTHPNPPVGAVLVKNKKIIAQGYTHEPGGMHAEKHAISIAGDEAIGATLYVTLEPCSHFGRTPPCTAAIIDAKIRKVIYGVRDPNPVIAGAGIKALRDAGIKVFCIEHPQLKMLAQACVMPFDTWLTQHRPFVVLKVATSKDKKISDRPGVRTKITGYRSDTVTHQLRRAIDGVLVGANTVRIDNPSLTARLGDKRHATQPARIIVSSHVHFDETFDIFDTKIARTIMLTNKEKIDKDDHALMQKKVSIIDCPMHDDVIDLELGLKKLAHHGFTSILIEAGKEIFSYALKHDLVDEVWWFSSSREIGSHGVDVSINLDQVVHRYETIKKTQLENDTLTIFSKKNS